MNGEENSKENVHIYGDTYDVHPANFSHFFRGNDTKCNRRIKKKKWQFAIAITTSKLTG